MNVYLLIGNIEYEASHVLGVFDNISKAENKKIEYESSGYAIDDTIVHYDYYEIELHEVQ